jgi:CubicO group peptidase (beta-lactamase class C family)
MASKLYLLRTALIGVLTATLLTPLLRGQYAPNVAVDKIFKDVAKSGSPGCALGVYRDGSVIYAKGYGLASIELLAPITPQTVFDIGSSSKQFTAASILLLQKQGKLSVSDDIRKYISEIPDYGQKVTILQLLNHTSGIRDYLTLMDLAGTNIDSVTNDDDALAFIARQEKLNFPPGSDYLYSNSGFFLLSIIVKRVSGKTLRDFADENIFRPLGMTHTQYRDDHTLLIPNRALAYDPKGEGYDLSVSYFEQTGDGAVHTTVEDLQKWDENFYIAQVGGKDFLAELQEQGRLNTGKTLEYAKGLFIGEFRGLRTVRHGGAWGGYRAELLRFPAQHFSVATLCNFGSSGPENRANQVAEIFLASQMKPEGDGGSGGQVRPRATSEATLSAVQMDAVVGTYRDPSTGAISRVSAKDGVVSIELFGHPFPLKTLGPTEFQMVSPIVLNIAFEDQARVLKITGEEELNGKYVRFSPRSISAVDLARYAGNYWSRELGVTYQIGVVDGKLRLTSVRDVGDFTRAASFSGTELQPSIQDEFQLAGTPMRIRFIRGASQSPTGFSLDAGRTKGLVFTGKGKGG